MAPGAEAASEFLNGKCALLLHDPAGRIFFQAVQPSFSCESFDKGSRNTHVPPVEFTCFICEPEQDVFVRDAAHVAHGGNAAVVGIILRPQVLQLQDLRLPLQLRPTATVYSRHITLPHGAPDKHALAYQSLKFH